MVANIGYRVVQRFSPDTVPDWARFVQFSGLAHVHKVVGLDSLLCPDLRPERSDEDWNHTVMPEFVNGLYDTPEYALARLGGGFSSSSHQLLAVVREPDAASLCKVELAGFDFLGLDLIEEETEISALTNCGGFDGAIAPDALNEFGLFSQLVDAESLRDALRTDFQMEPHANCTIWAVWRSFPEN
jgi:hypothetical protein